MAEEVETEVAAATLVALGCVQAQVSSKQSHVARELESYLKTEPFTLIHADNERQGISEHLRGLTGYPK